MVGRVPAVEALVHAGCTSPTLRRMSRALEWVERLQTATTREEVMAAVWDLRDDAYDHPVAWERFSVVRLLTFLGGDLEDTPDGTFDWSRFGALLGTALGAARSESGTNWDT